MCFVSIPIFTYAYNPTDAELRSSVYNYIGNQNLRQQQQDIMDNGNKSYKQSFDTYYQTTNYLKNELDLQLKELQMKQDAQDRDKAWQKEKALLDKELELNRKEEALRAQQKSIEVEKNSKDLVQYMQGVTDQMLKEEELKEKSEIKNTPTHGIIKQYQYEKQSSVLPVEPLKNETKFEHFKQASVSTIKKVGSWINPFSWFKKKVTTSEVFLKDQAGKSK